MKRRFLGWDRPALHFAADLLLGEIAPEGPADLTGCIVVLPGARAGRRLTELLLERCESAGRPLRPPRISLVGSLPELLYRPPLPQPGSVLDRIAWSHALQGMPRSSLEALFPNFSDEEAGGGALALAGTLRTLHAEVGASGKDFGDVAAICRSQLFFSDEERWTILAEIQARYRGLLGEMGFRDRESARRETLSSGSVVPRGDLWVVGAPDLPPVTRAFLTAAAGEGRVEILVAAPASLSGHFDELGCVLSDAWATEMAGLEERLIQVAPGPEAQADAVLAKLEELGSLIAAEDAVVGVPDPEVAPFLVESLGEAGIAVRDARGSPIEGTPGFRLLEGIAGYLESREFDRFAGLLRHPYLEAWLRKRVADPPDSLPASLDDYRELHLPLRLSAHGMPPSGGERESLLLAPRMREMRDALDGLLEPLRRSAPLSAWGSKIGDLFLALMGGDSVHRYVPGGRALVELAEALGRVLEELASLPSDLDRRVSGDRALRFALDELRGGMVPPEQDVGAIELLGWLELPLDDAPALLLTGANEPHLPDSVSADPFLPHGIRQAIGLLDNEGRWARDLFHLRTIIATRAHLLIVSGRRDASGNPLRLSRLLLAEDPETVARRILAFLEAKKNPKEEHGPPPSPAPARAGDPPTPSTFALPPEPVLSAPAPPPSIRVTDFRLILADPYRYALERVLGLEPKDDRARELDGAGFGGLAHKVLEEFADTSEASSEDPAKVRATLDALLDRAARLRFGGDALPAVRIQVEQLRARLAGFARWQAGWVREGWRIERAEAVPAGDGVAFTVDGEPILLKGKVDRVDRNQRTGEWCVLDYKTGEGGLDPDAAHRVGPAGAKRWVDLQLPLYRRLVPALQAESGGSLVPRDAQADVRVGYILLAQDPEEVGARLAEWSSTELEEAEEVARAAVRLLRKNRFVFARESSAIRVGDPLSVVIGGGVLRLDEEGDDGAP